MDAPYVVVASADVTLRDALDRFLGGLGCHVTTAISGIDCLIKMRAYPPDLLVLAPPLLWGSEADVAARLQQDPALAAVPVLMLGRSAGEDSVRLALDHVAAHLLNSPDTARVGPLLGRLSPRRPGHLTGARADPRFCLN